MKPKSKKQAEKIFKLIDQRVRCVILARHGQIGVDFWGDYFNKALQYEDDIIKELYGTSDLVKLGIEMGILKPDQAPPKPSKKKKIVIKKKKKRIKIKRKQK